MSGDKIVIGTSMSTVVEGMRTTPEDVQILFSHKSLMARHPDFDEEGKRVSKQTEKEIKDKVTKHFTNELLRKIYTDLTDEQGDALRRSLSTKLNGFNNGPAMDKYNIKDWMFPLFQDLKEIAESKTILFVEQVGRDFNGWKIKFKYAPSIGEFVEITNTEQRMCFTRDHLIKNSPFMVYQQFKAGCNV